MVKIPHEIVLIHMTNILLQHPKHMLGNVNSAAVAFFYHGHRINNSIQFVNTQSRQYRATITSCLRPSTPFYTIIIRNARGCEEIFLCYAVGSSAVSLNRGASVVEYCLTTIIILCYPIGMTENRIGVLCRLK